MTHIPPRNACGPKITATSLDPQPSSRKLIWLPLMMLPLLGGCCGCCCCCCSCAVLQPYVKYQVTHRAEVIIRRRITTYGVRQLWKLLRVKYDNPQCTTILAPLAQKREKIENKKKQRDRNMYQEEVQRSQRNRGALGIILKFHEVNYVDNDGLTNFCSVCDSYGQAL